ncbi:hypothetical protein [Haloprofundus halobius]|uniref:hypothetical protein n=1 Tax=Haloprofundus halobius TaxID=2876194 RepID=UPI001CD010F6|nr:hypothetical protein [Haloprofundus halobius]
MTERSPDRKLRRRSYLKALSAGVVGVGLAGCGESDSPSTATSTPANETSQENEIPYSNEYQTVVDVTEAGADLDEERPIDELLGRVAGDNTLLHFPKGVYRVEDYLNFEKLRNFGIVGDDAVIRPPEGFTGTIMSFSGVNGFRLEGITVDSSAKNTGARLQVLCEAGTNVVRDVRMKGYHDVSETHTHAFNIEAKGANTELLFENVDMSDGARNGTAVFIYPASDPGSITFKDCRIVGWYVQGLYGSAHGGPLQILGGEYANNGLAQIRVGGGNGDTQAVVRGAKVRVDETHGGAANMRGIWLKEGDNTLIEDCDIRITNLEGTTSSGGIVVDREHGRATIRNTKIHIDAPTYGIKARYPKAENFYAPSLRGRPDSWDLSVENLRITGNGNDWSGILLQGRANSALTGVEIQQPGTDRDGIIVSESPRTRLDELSIVAGRYPLVVGLERQEDTCGVELGEVNELETRSERADGDVQRYLLGESPPYCLSGELLESGSESGDLAITGVDQSAVQGYVVDG